MEIRKDFFYIEPSLALILSLVFAIIATKTYFSLSEDLGKSKLVYTLSAVRSGIKFQKSNMILRCQATPIDVLLPEQLVANDVTVSGPCKGVAMERENSRIISGPNIGVNPYNDENRIVRCDECEGPCDPKCLYRASLQYAGWCFDPKTDQFWAATNKESECSL